MFFLENICFLLESNIFIQKRPQQGYVSVKVWIGWLVWRIYSTSSGSVREITRHCGTNLYTTFLLNIIFQTEHFPRIHTR